MKTTVKTIDDQTLGLLVLTLILGRVSNSLDIDNIISKGG